MSVPAMPSHTLEAEGLDLVMVGSMNPSILHPQWFLVQRLINEAEAKDAQVKVVSHQVTDIQVAGINITCIPERLVLATRNLAHMDRLQDLALNLLQLLPHTPIRACGINPSAHYRVFDETYWHAIGDALAPKIPIWSDLFERPGMQSLHIQGRIPGRQEESTNVFVQPSPTIRPGLFVRANTHRAISEEECLSGAVARFLQEAWKPACGLAKCVAEKIFANIRPKDD